MNFKTVQPREVPSGAKLFDVREQEEWDAGHAPAAIHVPASTLAANLEIFVEDDEDIYVICRSGGRSFQVASWLAANGIEVINVAGGMSNWASQGLEIVTDVEGSEARII